MTLTNKQLTHKFNFCWNIWLRQHMTYKTKSHWPLKALHMIKQLQNTTPTYEWQNLQKILNTHMIPKWN